jgi:hypothetical protein
MKRATSVPAGMRLFGFEAQESVDLEYPEKRIVVSASYVSSFDISL